MRSPQTRRLLIVGLVAALYPLGGLGSSSAARQPNAPDDIAADRDRQQQIAGQFAAVLERNPRRGTALERIYAFHSEDGSLDAYVKQLQERTAAKPDDGVGWMVLGLMESQRGNDVAATAALKRAMELRAADPLAAYYLGQSLVLNGQSEQAIAAFEEAIKRQPGQADVLEIFQSLGKAHERAGRTTEALAVWNRLEQLFPGDARVLEQIAVALVEEGRPAEALPRYEAMAKSASDDYRRTVYRMEAAGLKVNLNRASEGIADLEQLLATLNPESWLFREVRRQIEAVFLRTDDREGLATYYTTWLVAHNEDVEAMSRLSRVLDQQARTPEAREWLDKSLKLAPSRKDLRLALIEQLVDDQRYGEAIAQYAELDKLEPNNPHYLREWGKLVLRDPTPPIAERRIAAEKVWRRLLAARPADPLVATQVADLFRQADMTAQALELYRHAVELAPAAPQYREYLGEYFHLLKMPEAALEAWRQMAAGDQRTVANVARLAEVLAQFGYLSEALPEIEAACQLDPKDFALQLKAAALQSRGKAFDAALEALSRAQRLAQNDGEREAVLAAQIKLFVQKGNLAELASKLSQEVVGETSTAEQWFVLARYYEALYEHRSAAKAIEEAQKREPGHTAILAAAARIAEQNGELKRAADLHRQLAKVDRRGRSECLQHVARLEAQLGRIDEALIAGRELLAASPGNVETSQFFADLCFRLGKAEEGLAALRRALRVNPNEPSLLLSLAAALSSQSWADEAIAVYWQAFDQQPQLDDKLSVIGKLVELHQQTNRFQQLLDRLERGRRQADRRREMTICLAQAHQSAGDAGRARKELEQLLNESSRDTQLLLQLSRLAEGESDLAGAVKFQQQLARLAPGPETEYRLAMLLSRSGKVIEAAEILSNLATNEADLEKFLRNVDSLITSRQDDTALALIESRLRRDLENWELLYRQGIARAKRHPTDAASAFEAILRLGCADDELCIALANRSKNPRASGGASGMAVPRPTQSRLALATTIRAIIELDGRVQATVNSANQLVAANQLAAWRPQDYAQARMAAIGWLYRFAINSRQGESFLASMRPQVDEANVTLRSLWDWAYLQSIVQDVSELRRATHRLAERGGWAEQVAFLNQLTGSNQARISVVNGARVLSPMSAYVLSPEELDLAVRCYREVIAGQPSGGAGPSALSATVIAELLRHLHRAGRTDEERQILEGELQRAESPALAAHALQIASLRGDRSALVVMLARMVKIARDKSSGTPPSAPSNLVETLVAAELSKPASDPATTVELLDLFLDYHAARMSRQPSGRLARPAAPPVASGGRVLIPVYSNGRLTYTVANPGSSQAISAAALHPTRYFDMWSLTVLRAAFNVLQQPAKGAALLEHLQARVEQSPANERVYALLAVGHVQAWQDNLPGAIDSFSAATALDPPASELKLMIAKLHGELKQYAQALALLDPAAKLDPQMQQQQELLVLDLATRWGDDKRASAAAKSLYGMRLDAQAQVQVAGHMRRLGMTEQADQLLARAQKQGRGNVPALSTMLRQQMQGGTDQSIAVARQILQQSRSQSPGSATAKAQMRADALQVLKQSGKLPSLIANLESQARQSPQSIPLREELLDYYQAAGDSDKAFAMQSQLIDLRPNDGESRLRFAQQLYTRSNLDEAWRQYLEVVKKHPQLVARRYQEVAQAFHEIQREPELIAALVESDLAAFGQPRQVIDLIRYVLRTPRGSIAGGELFRKAWERFPAERSRLMANFYSSEIWKRPENQELARRSLLPTSTDVSRDPWFGLCGGAMSFDQAGRITSTLKHVLDCAEQLQQLDDLRTLIAPAVIEHPGWLAGKAILTLVELRQGKSVSVKSAVQPLLDASGNDYQLRHARWIVAQELEPHEAHRELAMQLYRRAAIPDDGKPQQFRYSPARRLVQMHLDRGDRAIARNLLLAAANTSASDGNRSQGTYLGLRADNLLAIAALLREIDFPGDALRLYRQLITDSAFSSPAISEFDGNAPAYFRKQAETNLAAIIRSVTDKPTAAATLELLSLPPQATAGKPAIDLLLGLTAESGAPPTLDSPLVKLLSPASGDPDYRRQIEVRLESLLESHPRDLSVQIVAALFAIQGPYESKRTAAIARLMKLIEASPPEAGATVGPAVSPWTADAASQVGLWLVARECLQRPEHYQTGESLAQRAILAARQQQSEFELTAILYESGKLALKRGDNIAADRHWNELIDEVLVKSRQPQGGAMTPPPATRSQFRLGATIAELAAEHKLVTLSLRAIRESLSGGWPLDQARRAAVMPAGILQAGPTPYVANALSPLPSQYSPRALVEPSVATEVRSRLWKLALIWFEQHFPPAEVCQVLEGIVFPAARPGEIVLYEQIGDLTQQQSVGHTLVEWTVLARRSDALRQHVGTRRARAIDCLCGEVLLAQLAIALRKPEDARPHLQSIVREFRLAHTSDLLSPAIHAVAVVAAEPQLADEVAPLIDLLLPWLSAKSPTAAALRRIREGLPAAAQP